MRAVLAGALAVVTGCSLFVDLDGIRPGADVADAGDRTDARDSDRDGAGFAFELWVPDFHLPEAGGGPVPALLEGVGYRYLAFEGDALTPATQHAPIPVVGRGVAGADAVTVSLPADLPGPIEVCGALLGPGEARALGPLGADESDCGLAGDLAVFTVAIPVFFDWGKEEAVELKITVSDAERTLAIRGLDELGIPPETPLPEVSGQLWSAVFLKGTSLTLGDLAADGFRLRATSYIELADATIDASAPLSACASLGCAGGPGGARGGDTGEDGEGEGGGEGARCTVITDLGKIRGKGGGGGGHGDGAREGEAGTSLSCEGGGPGASFARLLLLPIDELAGGGGGGGGGIAPGVATAQSEAMGGVPLVLGGGGGGGGGVIAIESAGTVRVSGALSARGGAGNDGQYVPDSGGGGGGGGAGGAIRIQGARVTLLGATISVDGGRGGAAGGEQDGDVALGAGGVGASGRLRIDGMLGVFANAATTPLVRAPDFLIAPPAPIQRTATPEIAIHPGSLDHDIVVGVRGAGEGTFAAALVAGNYNGPLPQPLAPGLNEVCLFLEKEPALTLVEALPDARRCVWVAYLP
jgi:hypothetical protein